VDFGKDAVVVSAPKSEGKGVTRVAGKKGGGGKKKGTKKSAKKK
jgi:hypothetical protein